MLCLDPLPGGRMSLSSLREFFEIKRRGLVQITQGFFYRLTLRGGPCFGIERYKTTLNGGRYDRFKHRPSTLSCKESEPSFSVRPELVEGSLSKDEWKKCGSLDFI
jgi:hypothetical protein